MTSWMVKRPPLSSPISSVRMSKPPKELSIPSDRSIKTRGIIGIDAHRALTAASPRRSSLGRARGSTRALVRESVWRFKRLSC